MIERFNKLSLDVTIWNSSTPDNIIDIFDNKLNNVTKACSQSHVNIWKFIIYNKLDYAFIIEDDACFDKKWFIKLEELYKNNIIIDNDWGAIFLNSSEPITTLFNWSKAEEQFLTG